MEILKKRIQQEGKCHPGGVLKVDSFINHQMDPILMQQIAEEFASRFSDLHITKILTIEASGIAPAIMVGLHMKLPVLFAKKRSPNTMENMLSTKVFSFTKQREYDICLSKDFLTPEDKILFIDDFLAQGNAAKGMVELVGQAGAEIVGMGFIIEKHFQHGRVALEKRGIRIESLAIIESLENCAIKFGGKD